MECEYCHNVFSTKPNLIHHQKTAKYCLKLRNTPDKTQYICHICKKSYTSNYRLTSHLTKCIGNSSELLKLREKVKLQDKEITVLRDHNNELKQTIKDLQEKLKEVAVQAVSRPTTTKNTQINNYIQKLECITDDHIQEQVQHLTIEHIQKGPEGYAEYALEYPLKNRIVCVDYARRKVKFKDREGNVITDPEMSSIATKLFESIKDRNKALIFSYGTELRERFGDEMDTVVKLLEYKNDVENSADGSKPDFFHDFVRSVCGKTILE